MSILDAARSILVRPLRSTTPAPRFRPIYEAYAWPILDAVRQTLLASNRPRPLSTAKLPTTERNSTVKECLGCRR